MKRVEITANHSIQLDLFDALDDCGLRDRYTLIPSLLGEGSNGGRLGSPVWPEENFMLLLYIDESKVEPLFRNCKVIKEKFPEEGLKMAVSDVDLVL